MEVFLEMVLFVLLLLVFFQDMRYRAIHVALPLVIALLGMVLFFIKNYPVWILWHTFLFLVLTCSGLYVYLSFKAKKLVNPFISIGEGDFLLFFAVIPFFSTSNYILFFITGMLFSMFAFFIIRAITKTNLVPLAGLLALYMVLLKCIAHITDLDFFETNLV
ncbi:hypothetical protein [Ulvibacterium sp.]|uniref:hypothetical protein n=1 Tax=Ulvibacterium sp. TaxID=2665914 RepID=UPI003CC529A7